MLLIRFFIISDNYEINDAMREMIMKPQINADQGYKLREKVYIDSPLRHFIEDELLPNSSICNDKFYETLSILVIEFGANCRKTDVEYSLLPTFKYNDKPIETIILDEFCCEVPQVIITTLVLMLKKETSLVGAQCQSQQKLIERINVLLPTLGNNISIINQSDLTHAQVA